MFGEISPRFKSLTPPLYVNQSGISSPGISPLNGCEIYGAGASASNVVTNATVVGNAASAVVSTVVVIGQAAKATAGGTGIAIGTSATVGGAGAVGLGPSVSATGGNAIAIGSSATNAQTNSIVMGAGATSNAGGQCILGGPNAAITVVLAGNSITSTAPQASTTFTTTSAVTTADTAGTTLILAAGKGTGLATGGSGAGNVKIQTATPGSTGSTANTLVDRVNIDSAGNVVLNASGSALATNATAGFSYIPSCAGTPTGVPSSLPTGTIPIVYDSTNNFLYIYNSGWKKSTVYA